MHVTTVCTVKFYFMSEMCARTSICLGMCAYVSWEAIKKKKNILHKSNVSGTTRREKTGDECSGGWGGGGDGWSSWLQVLAALQFAALLPVRGGRHADVHYVVPWRLIMSWSIGDLLLWYDAIDLCKTEHRSLILSYLISGSLGPLLELRECLWK